MQRIKTGAARIALGYEAQAPGRLTVVPVGLSFEARKRFRGRVLVSYGAPVAVSSYLAVYREEPAKALHTQRPWFLRASSDAPDGCARMRQTMRRACAARRAPD